MNAAPAQPAMPAAPPAGPSLRDIHLPAEPSWWPPAPGWWALALIVLATLCLAFWYGRRRRRRLGQRRAVLLELDRLVEQYQRAGDQAALISGMHQLLRRLARRHDVKAAQQRGEAWQQTLQRVPVDASILERLLALDDLIYQPPAAFDEAASIDAVRQWLQAALIPGNWKDVAVESTDA